MLEAVVDTSVFIRGLLKGKTSRPILAAFIDNKFQLVTSHNLLDELIFTIRKPRLASILPESECASLISLIKEGARFVDPQEEFIGCRDSKDNKFVSCALAGNTRIIVSADSDLLDLSPLKSAMTTIEIIPPLKFLERLKSRRMM